MEVIEVTGEIGTIDNYGRGSQRRVASLYIIANILYNIIYNYIYTNRAASRRGLGLHPHACRGASALFQKLSLDFAR